MSANENTVLLASMLVLEALALGTTKNAIFLPLGKSSEYSPVVGFLYNSFICLQLLPPTCSPLYIVVGDISELLTLGIITILSASFCWSVTTLVDATYV